MYSTKNVGKNKKSVRKNGDEGKQMKKKTEREGKGEDLAM